MAEIKENFTDFNFYDEMIIEQILTKIPQADSETVYYVRTAYKVGKYIALTLIILTVLTLLYLFFS